MTACAAAYWATCDRTNIDANTLRLAFIYTRFQNYTTFHKNSLHSNVGFMSYSLLKIANVKSTLFYLKRRILNKNEVDMQIKINSKPAPKKSISKMTFKLEK